MEYWISLFIDNEMNLDEKIHFVEKVHADKGFREEALTILRQEKELRSEIVDKVPDFDSVLGGKLSEKVQPVKQRFSPVACSFFRPWAIWASTLAVLALLMFANMPSERSTAITQNRFVIYQPDMTQVEISGTFTSWERIPLRPVGSSGYWEARLDLPAGEHRYFYILDGRQQVADPTVRTREKDDFGGENTVLFVGDSI